MFNIIKYRKFWYLISGLLFVAAVAAISVWRLNFGIDFTGGSLMEVRYAQNRISQEVIEKSLTSLNLSGLTTQTAGDKNLILRFQNIDEETHQQILTVLKNEAIKLDKTNQVEELHFEAVGPAVGKEMKIKSIYAIVVVLFTIILFIAWSFNKVSKPVASWKYGLVSVAALFHDIIITAGVFSVLGRFMGVEINLSFVAAILTVLGYSVHDTIVVFDRIRENLPKSHEDFENTVNASVNQTFARSINTSVTTLLSLTAVYFFGGESIQNFTLALIVGIFFGTYSSIFIASPLLVTWDKWTSRDK